MNLRAWSKEHTKGFLVGILTIMIGVLIVVGYYTWQTGNSFEINFRRFLYIPSFTAKVLSMAAIANLPWFHFGSLRTGNWAFGQGIIMATVLDLFVMLLFKFII